MFLRNRPGLGCMGQAIVITAKVKRFAKTPSLSMQPTIDPPASMLAARLPVRI